MRKLKLLLTCLFMASITLVSAQTKTASGKVVAAEDGAPVIGASVVVKGTSQGVLTDTEGKYSLTVPTSATTLVISLVGMTTVEVDALPNQQVTMEADVSELDEVIVTAFGTTTKKSFTGSAAVVKSEDLSKRQSSNVTNSLSGKVAGLQGLSGNGQPGTGSTIRIRGIGSMSASNAPLYVVDGVPYDTDISAINNADIESVTVLKDATSNALYGARGANGVIIITTKKGNTKDAKINLEAKWGNNSRAVPSYSVMTDPGMYYETFYRALFNSKSISGEVEAHEYAHESLLSAASGGLGYQAYTVPNGQRLIGRNFKLNPKATLGYLHSANGVSSWVQPDNWYQELFKSDNLRQEYNVNVSGSSGGLTYYGSVGYLDDTGIISNSGFSRISTRANIDYQAKKWLKIGSNMTFIQATVKSPDDQTVTNSSGNLFYLTSNMAPIYPLYIRDEKGNIRTDRNGFTMYDYGDGKTVPNLIRPFMSMSNPASNIQLNKELYTNDYFVGKWYAAAELFEGFKLNYSFGATATNEKYNLMQNKYYGQYADQGGYVSVTKGRFRSYNNQFLATYVNKIGLHNLDLLAGVESYNFTVGSLFGSKKKIYQDNVSEVGNAIVDPNTTSSTRSYSTLGLLFRGIYDYDSKYFGSVSFRRDGSSSFAPENRWGNFWSVGGAWNLTEEDFMSDLNQINLLKLKASYGAQGNDKLFYQGTATINYYPYIDQYDISNNNNDFATARSYKGNRNITWETSYNLNVGVDFSFFNERFGGTVEFFSRRTEDMLYYRPVAPSLGYSSLPVNIGSVRNSGLEVDLNGEIIKTSQFKWTAYGNMTFIKNKILKLAPELGGEWISGSYIYREGESMYNFYIRKFAGVDPATGQSLWYKDVKEGDNVVGTELTTNWQTATQYEMGDILPKVYGGFGTAFDFYGIDFSVDFSYQLGGRIMDNYYLNMMHNGSSSYAGRNWHTDILRMWTPENTDTDVPRVNSADATTNSISNRFMISSDYISLQNITLGYSLPSRLLRHWKISKVRVFGVVDNVWLGSARKGLDPRQSYTTSNAALYSPIRSASVGINISF